MGRGIGLLICLLLLPLCLATAQETPPADSGQTTIAEEYLAEEFPPWMLDLRRGEILFFGSLPITFFLVIECVDFYRLINVRIMEDEWQLEYAPWPVEAGEVKPDYSETEQAIIVGGAVLLSVAVVVTDYFIGRARGRDLAGRK